MDFVAVVPEAEVASVEAAPRSVECVETMPSARTE
jgi:hypothetical protein